MLAHGYWIPLIPSLFLTQSLPLEPHFQALPGWKYWQCERWRVEVKRDRAKKGNECFRNTFMRYQSADFESLVLEKGASLHPSHNCPVYRYCSSLLSPDVLLCFLGLLGYFLFTEMLGHKTVSVRLQFLTDSFNQSVFSTELSRLEKFRVAFRNRNRSYLDTWSPFSVYFWTDSF